ncbi:HEPN domain-containing protein [Bdellovibrionota bacterium FG-1]
MTDGQKRRADYDLRAAIKIAQEAHESHLKKDFERVVRKAGESIELYIKGKLLEKGIEPAKTHDLNQLASGLNSPALCSLESIFEFLTGERIPSFYGAEDFIPDQSYVEQDSLRCLEALKTLGLLQIG